MEQLLLVPLDDSIVLPGMSVTLALDLGDEERIVLVPHHENEFANVGTVAAVADRMQLPGGAQAVTVEGLHRATIGAASTGPGGELRVEIEPHEDGRPDG